MRADFSILVSELRKEKGVSQKEAALELNVSQALLSHYERGIRECGLDFLCNAAEYYGVTTDYLLGRSKSKFGFSQAFDAQNEIADDEQLSISTVYRAMSNVVEKIGKSDYIFGDHLLNVNTMCLYRIILYGVRCGKLPRSWLNEKIPVHDERFVQVTENVIKHLLNVKENKQNDTYEKPYACVETVIKSAQKLLTYELSDVHSFLDCIIETSVK
ncbi:MAG TPA: helix-turn-helix transcriptional regulator [Clostridia bacterium]|nr:helix-turn-helix transcriptional regulator [Clostridia bacterium]